MAENRNVLLGILFIILGILVIAFPLISVFTVSVLAGFAILFLGIWFLAHSFDTWHKSKAASIVNLLLAIFAIIIGIGMFGNILAFSFLASLWLYISGFFLILAGVIGLVTREAKINKGTAVLGIILGIIYLILGIYALDPLYLAIIIGIWLIVDGFALFFVNPLDIPAPEESEE
ncbi:MAG: hypothetical protein CIT01_10670 [Methanobacterium sp. BRmetb2]|nr:MAG: hypothetical protein CIT01_10670 [Methanobacterium sp. BRmetb2]